MGAVEEAVLLRKTREILIGRIVKNFITSVGGNSTKENCVSKVFSFYEFAFTECSL